jgi:RNA polymerase sigma-70 factor (ECF subfamily)
VAAAVLLGGLRAARRLALTAIETPSELAARIRAGEREAEGELVRRFGPGVAAILRRAANDPSLAQDLYQDVFRLAIEKIRHGDLKDPAKLPGFLCGLARNLAIDHFRTARRRRVEPLEAVEPRDASADPLERLLSGERASLVREVMAELGSDRDRQLLFRFYVGEEDKDRLCRDLDLSSLHFNRVLFRARQRYKELYERRFLDERASARGRDGDAV